MNHTDSFLSNPKSKRIYNRMLFTIVAPRYRIVTQLLSWGRDAVWKRHLVASLPDITTPNIIDIASGTGDIALACAKRFPNGNICALDLTSAMVASRQKNGTTGRVNFAIQDMCHLGIKSGTAEILTGGYALRNAPDLAQALIEVVRVLKPGGTAAFLDFSKPENRFVAAVEYIILAGWGCFIGLLMHGKPWVYWYIAKSLRQFPNHTELCQKCAQSGLIVERKQFFFFGIVSLLICRKHQN